MKKRLFSILLVLCMVLCLVPTSVFAEGEAEEAPACVCETTCMAEAMNAECSVCGAEGALAENCGKYAPEESGQTGTSNDAPAITAADVQALIDALPEAETISEDNAADVEVQLEAIDEAKVQLSDEDFAVLDFTRYDAAVAALMALSGEPDTAFAPQTANDHTHCYCGGNITAGDHASHSDMTYTAWDGTSSITYTNNTAYVYLTENATLSGHLTVDGKTLYLCLNGKTLASNGTAKIQVKNGGRLVLCDCQGGGTFKGATQSVWGGACIYLYTSTLDMFGGKLTGGKVTSGGGGGAIALDDQQCIFNMYGGEISGNNGNNYGGAIFRKFNNNIPNTTGGAFNMYGGTIKDNTAKNGGAFFSTTGGTINMTGGTISGNKATQSSNDAGGGAIYMRGSGTINISGSAQITGNSSSLDGGAILIGWGTINISDSAKISNNTANRWGGAICLRQDSNQPTTLNMRGGEISGNTATKEGGAVHVLDKDCQFFLYDGKITGNTSGDGGAIYLNQEPSWLIMQGGEISGNTATGNGGGVYIYRTGSVCQLYSGKIENNKASGNGGGIYINPSNSGQLRVGNKPLVQNNTVSGKANNVYLPSGKTLTIEIGMSKGASIGVTTANTSYPVAFSNAYRKDYGKCFFADDINAHVEYKDDQKLYLVSGMVPRTLTVTFDPNGGTLDEADKTKSLTTGEPYGTLPVPSYAGYDFAGWYTEKGGGTEIKENTTVTVFGTQTLYAHWTPIHVHAYTQQVQKPEALKTPADCTNNAVYYLSCACGEVSTNDADTFTAANTALDHDWGAWTQNSDEKTHTRICKRDTSHTETENCHGGTATCTAKAVCTVCGGEYGEVDMTNHTDTTQWIQTETTHTQKYKCCGVIVVPVENHEWKDGVCTECDYECVHQYNWQSENGMYWQHCTICGFDTNKKAIPTIPINGADKVCRTQDYKFSFALPEGATDAAYGYEFIGLGDGPLTPTVEDNLYSGILKATIYPAEENSFKLIVSAKTADDFEFSAEKTVAIQNEHSGGTATCTEQATCEICGEKYGDLKPHSYSVKWSTGEASHWHECTECRAKTDEAEHTDTNKDHKCDVCDKVLSECTDTNKDHKCDICGKTLSEHSGGTATCKDKAKCEVCGESYGEPDADNHTDLQHFPAVAATKTSEGNIEYWYCSGCGKYYKDAKATQEITKADTVTAKLPEEKPTSPKTGDTSNLTLWIALLLASGGVGTITTVVSRKKKRSVK